MDYPSFPAAYYVTGNTVYVETGVGMLGSTASRQLYAYSRANSEGKLIERVVKGYVADTQGIKAAAKTMNAASNPVQIANGLESLVRAILAAPEFDDDFELWSTKPIPWDKLTRLRLVLADPKANIVGASSPIIAAGEVHSGDELSRLLERYKNV